MPAEAPMARSRPGVRRPAAAWDAARDTAKGCPPKRSVDAGLLAGSREELLDGRGLSVGVVLPEGLWANLEVNWPTVPAGRWRSWPGQPSRVWGGCGAGAGRARTAVIVPALGGLSL
jgi:hypothetical protein